jgi:drug/metabolite transporter (DMT)-like permease
MMKTDRSRILLALGSLYLIWGSTFLGIRVALEGYPPLLLAGLRFVVAGAVTYAWARLRGAPAPTRSQWRSSLIVGTLLVCANACVVIAEQWVSSGSRVRPTLAASYAYVHPVVAVGLGAAVAGESVAPRAVGALALILSGVAMLALRRQAA